MTDSDWLTSTDPQAMLHHLLYAPVGVSGRLRGTGEGGRVIASARKLRLFSVACCRQVWDGTPCERCGGEGVVLTVGPAVEKMFDGQKCPSCLGSGRIGGLTDPRSRRAVEIAERYADGGATEKEREEALNECLRIEHGSSNVCVSSTVLGRMPPGRPNPWGRVFEDCGLPAAQAALLRDIFNPFLAAQYEWAEHHARPFSGVKDTLYRLASRKMVPQKGGEPFPDEEWLAVNWLAWNDGRVRKTAQAIYAGRAFDRMPLLGDALESAGCEDVELLMHCRGKRRVIVCAAADMSAAALDAGAPEEERWVDAGPHARGCWVLDLLLGKS